MSTPLQLYTLLYATLKGALITEAGSIEITRDLKASDVETLAKGWAGLTPGAAVCDLRIKNAVPSADFEIDAGKYMKAYEVAEICVLGPGGKQLVVDCFFLSDSLSSSVNNPTNLDFTLRGPFADWS